VRLDFEQLGIAGAVGLVPLAHKGLLIDLQAGCRCAPPIARSQCRLLFPDYLCPELPDGQKRALQYGAKVPLLYTVVAARNWTAFRKLGVRSLSSPGMYHTGVRLDQAVSIGGYECRSRPPSRSCWA
jgi:hypothetical protein